MDKVLDALGQEGALLGAVGAAFVLHLGRRLKTRVGRKKRLMS